MPMVVVVTRDVAPRFRGFLASCMSEIAPGVYIGPEMTAGVRERIWRVLDEWHATLGGGGIVMTWRDKRLPGGMGLALLGEPPKTILDHEGVLLVKRDLAETEKPLCAL